MTAKQLKYFGKRRTRRRAARSAPRRRRRSHSAPRRRSRSLTRRRVRHARRHRRSNPVKRALGGGFIGSTVTGAGVGALGALATDIIWSFIPVPAQYKTGNIGMAVKAAGSIAIGMLSAKVVGSKLAKDATIGALTVQLYQFAKPLLAGAGVPGLGYYGAGYALNAFVPNSLNDWTDVTDTKNFPPDQFNGLREYISDIPNSLNEYISEY